MESVQANLSLSELGGFPVEEISISEQKSRNKLLADIELMAKKTRQTSDTLFELRNSMLPTLNSDE